MSRIPNHQIPAMFRERVPFKNYNASIVAENSDGLYSVWHWDTHIISYDADTKKVWKFDLAYYSQTTSALQGKIIRDLIPPSEAERLYREALDAGDKNLAKRIKRLAHQ